MPNKQKRPTGDISGKRRTELEVTPTFWPVGRCYVVKGEWAVSDWERKCVDRARCLLNRCWTSRDVMMTSGDNCLGNAVVYFISVAKNNGSCMFGK